VRVPLAEPRVRTRYISFRAPERSSDLAAPHETPPRQRRVDIGEQRRRELAAELGEYPLRQLRVDIPGEATAHRPRQGFLRWIRHLLVLVGLIGAGIYGWFYAEARVYQAYESWRLDQIAKHSPADPKTFLASYFRGNRIEATSKPPAPVQGPAQLPPSPAPLAGGVLIGRIEIPRLGLSTIVLQGDSDQVLRKGAGHIPSTSLPGGSGNVAIAGHRDTFFRPLKDIQQNDNITLATTAGTYHYRVDSVQVVGPSDTQVLAPSDQPSLTLVTCYPFYFVGSAPNRYIVHAQQIEPSPVAQQPSAAAEVPKPEAASNLEPLEGRQGVGSALGNGGESVGINGNQVLHQLKVTLGAIYPPVWRRMQVWENATLARLQKERDRLHARIAAALESYMEGDD
jgi:sortase A